MSDPMTTTQAPEGVLLADAIQRLTRMADEAETSSAKTEDWHEFMPGDIRASMKADAAAIRTILSALQSGGEPK